MSQSAARAARRRKLPEEKLPEPAEQQKMPDFRLPGDKLQTMLDHLSTVPWGQANPIITTLLSLEMIPDEQPS